MPLSLPPSLSGSMVLTSRPGTIILTTGTWSSGLVRSTATTLWNPASMRLPRTTSMSSST